MTIDLTKLIFHSNYNAFKNNSIQRGSIAIPASFGAAGYTGTLTFTLTRAADFLQVYSYATDYGQYNNFSDGAYHNAWREINTNNDYFLIGVSSVFGPTPSIYAFKLSVAVNGLTVTVTLKIPGTTAPGDVVTITHPTFVVPIDFIDYALAG